MKRESAMTTIRPIALVLGSCLLQACATPPAKPELAMQGITRVRHSADQTAATYYQLGKYHQQRGELDLARAAYTQSIFLDSRQLDARNAIATLDSQQGRLDEAKALLLQLVIDYPAASQPYNNLGFVYYLQGNFDAAVNTLQRALTLEPGSERARNNLKLADDARDSRIAAAPVERAIVAGGHDAHDTGTTAPAVLPTAAPALFALQVSAPTAEPPVASPAPQQTSRMELVEVTPNVFDLKLRATPVLASQPAPRATYQPQSAIGMVNPIVPTQVEIANGNGVTGMAKRIGAVLDKQGISIGKLTNERPYRQQTTEIRYRPGHEQQAAALKAALQGNATLVAVTGSAATADLRLVLGRDAVTRIAAIEHAVDAVALASTRHPG